MKALGTYCVWPKGQFYTEVTPDLPGHKKVNLAKQGITGARIPSIGSLEWLEMWRRGEAEHRSYMSIDPFKRGEF